MIEEQLKAGELPCLVATSSLELGIDMGAVDLVLQVESPKSVTRGLQRIGRAGHGVGEISKGRIFPKFRADLLECAVVVKRMREGLIETTVVPRNPLDVLAQQIVAMAASADEERRCASTTCTRWSRARYTYAELSRAQLENVLDMLDGRYPSEEFGELRPRIVWDRVAGTIRPRKGARALAITNAGTIPDRGLFSVNLPDGRRVGELDEEMVYEARPGQTFLLGASTLADRGHHARPRDRHARARRAGRRPVLARRRDRAPARARRGGRRLRALGGRAGRRRRSRPTTTSTSWPPQNLLDFLREQQDGDARRAERPHDRHRALPRRDRRLAGVRPLALRRPRARRVGARAVAPASATSTASSPTRSGPTTGSSSTSPTPTSRPAPS